jgi:hypothetical protein
MKIETAALRGYVVKEKKKEVWIEDRQGTYIVKRSDIVSTSTWEAAKEKPSRKGKPVQLNIRDQAVIHEIRPMKINLSAKPITMGDLEKIPEIKGNEQLMALARCWTKNLGFSAKPQAGELPEPWPPVLTTCCYFTGEWGLDCPADDCGQELASK